MPYKKMVPQPMPQGKTTNGESDAPLYRHASA
jgi:hypothetical protein